MNITLKPAEVVTINEIVISRVADSFEEKKIIAFIKDVPKPLLLWSGEEEYTAAGNWTNESALARVTEVLALPNIPWAF
jgi:hypothetical protein